MASPAVTNSMAPAACIDVQLLLFLLLLLQLLLLSQYPSSSSAAAAKAPSHTLSINSTLSGNQTLVSQNGIFVLGFAEVGAAGGSFYLAIWYQSAGQSPSGLVWTAPTRSSVANDALLQLDPSGDLLLFVSESQNYAITWATQTQNKGVSHAELTSTGNLVLYNARSQPVWQSFQHPTNTLLPGQFFYTDSVLQSWTTPTNPFPGAFQLILQEDQNLVVYQDLFGKQTPCWASGTYHSGGLSTGSTVYAKLDSKGSFLIHHYVDQMGSFQNLVYNSSDYGKAHAERRLTLDSDGFLRLYSWNDASMEWQTVWNSSIGSCSSPSPSPSPTPATANPAAPPSPSPSPPSTAIRTPSPSNQPPSPISQDIPPSRQHGVPAPAPNVASLGLYQLSKASNWMLCTLLPLIMIQLL